jgi:hypothetical protein
LVEDEDKGTPPRRLNELPDSELELDKGISIMGFVIPISSSWSK